MLPIDFLERLAKEKKLTKAQNSVFLALFSEGKTKEEVIKALHISSKTFISHMNVIYNSFGIDGKGTGKLDRLRSIINQKYCQSNSSAAKNPDFIKNAEDVDNLLQTMRSHNSAANPQPQESAIDLTISKNPDFVQREESMANSTPDDIDVLVLRLRSHFRDKIQDQCGYIRILDVDWQVAVDNIAVALAGFVRLAALARRPAGKKQSLLRHSKPRILIYPTAKSLN